MCTYGSVLLNETAADQGKLHPTTHTGVSDSVTLITAKLRLLFFLQECQDFDHFCCGFSFSLQFSYNLPSMLETLMTSIAACSRTCRMFVLLASTDMCTLAFLHYFHQQPPKIRNTLFHLLRTDIGYDEFLSPGVARHRGPGLFDHGARSIGGIVTGRSAATQAS